MSLFPREIRAMLEDLRASTALAVEAPPGGGGLALASAHAHQLAMQGVDVLVIDVGGTSGPHAWAHPKIYVVVPSTIRDGWKALDLALRSGAFGLVVSLDLPRDPRLSLRFASRVRSALAKSRSKLLLVGEQAPFSVPRRVRIASEAIEWQAGPLGDAPHARSFAVDVGGGSFVTTLRTHCVRPSTHASNPSAPSTG